MGVPAAFDPIYHHVGLGVDASNLKGYFVAGQYSKQLANPVFSKPSDIGTDDLVGMRSLSNWTVDDFSGGEFQEDWSDPAMFSECIGMLPDQLSRRIRTIRPLDAYLTSETQAAITPLSMDNIGGFLFVVFNNTVPEGRVFRYNPANPASSPQKETVSATYLPAGKLLTASAWNTATSRLWLGSNKPQVDSYDWNSAAAAGSRLVHYATYGAPSACTKVTGIHIFGLIKLIVTENNASGVSTLDDDSDVWIYVSGSGASAKWSKVGNLPGTYVSSVTYNNAVYILSRNGNMRTYLSMTQGSQVFPVLSLPYFFRGQAMVEYAGRLYVAGTGYDLDGNDHHGELYEVNGASLRLVRTFASSVNDADPSTATAEMATTSPGTSAIKRKRIFSRMGALGVAEGLLWMPDSSYLGLEAYDATTDAFFGGPRYRHGDDTAIQFTKLVPFGDSIYIWGNGTTAAKTGLYRTERKADSGEAYKPYFVTSDFHPEPARDKLWSRFVVHTHRVAPTLYYSFDSGESWTSIGAGTTVTTGNRKVTEYDLSGLATSKVIRFKLKFAMTGAADEACAYLLAHSLSFMIRGDTKRRWQFTVIGAEKVEDFNLDSFDQVPVDLSTTLWSLKDTAAPISFKDLDRVTYKVVITDITDAHTPPDPQGERYINLALLEV